jgi:hypothetical protein
MREMTINQFRAKSIVLARSFRELFWSLPIPKRWIWRWLFLAEDGQTVRRVGEHALADLREFAFLNRSTFDTDPLIMARRAGRREVAMRIINYLNLDEDAVQTLMEIDDGIG